MIAAVVLAAGRSTRMGARNKLLLADGPRGAMVARVVAACRASRAAPLVVVTGHQAACVEAAAGTQDVRFVRVAEGGGLSASLRAGIAALADDVAGALVCLGDMPLVQAGTLDALIAAWRPGAVVVPVFEGQRGNPVLWDRRFFAEIGRLTGDTGARRLLAGADVTQLSVPDRGVVEDFDTEASVAGWAAPA